MYPKQTAAYKVVATLRVNYSPGSTQTKVRLPCQDTTTELLNKYSNLGPELLRRGLENKGVRRSTQEAAYFSAASPYVHCERAKPQPAERFGLGCYNCCKARTSRINALYLKSSQVAVPKQAKAMCQESRPSEKYLEIQKPNTTANQYQRLRGATGSNGFGFGFFSTPSCILLCSRAAACRIRGFGSRLQASVVCFVFTA